LSDGYPVVSIRTPYNPRLPKRAVMNLDLIRYLNAWLDDPARRLLC